MNLTAGQKRALLKIARESIASAVKNEKIPEYDIKDSALNIKCGAFVTLHINDNLRGCIGNITAETPLWQTVSNMAVESALRDPRFYPLTPDELKKADIEVSALSPLKKIKDPAEVKVGKHGLLIKSGSYQGLLLPQVATSYRWDRTVFLEQTCCKAGLNKNCYRKKDTEIFIFSAVVFSEKNLDNKNEVK
ncbi:MAG: AmmeMemoRadiSam system protein A [Actinomycetota bacterium]|nr:AmmeMemoRadiSam system protein A [Actinomycetota bacterium]